MPDESNPSHSNFDGCSTSPVVNEWAAGWRPLIAAMVGVGMTYSLFLISAGLFIVPMQSEFGWSRSAAALGPMVMIVSGLLNPVSGIIINRFGPRRVAIIGVVALILAYVLLAVAPADKRYVYSVAVYLAAAGAMTNVIAYSRVVASWFSRNIGTAIGLTTSGVACSIAMPIVYAIVSAYGWRAGYLALAGIAALALPVLFLWLRVRPLPDNQPIADGGAGTSSPDGVSVAVALRDVRFWTLVTSLGIAALAIGGFLSQLVPLLQSRGVTAGLVVGLASIFSLTIPIGRIGAGCLLDFVGRPRLVASLALIVPAIGAAVLAMPDLASQPWYIVATGVIMIGLALGAEADFSAFFVIKLFGMKSYSVLYGLILAVISLSMAGGGLIYAVIFDHFQDYRVAIYFSSGGFLLASLIFTTLRLPKMVREA